MSRRFILAAIAITCAAPGVMALSNPPVPGAAVLVMLPPWADGDGLVAAAGGQVVGPLRAPFAILALSQNADFAEQLRLAGAWAVADGTALARICGTY